MELTALSAGKENNFAFQPWGTTTDARNKRLHIVEQEEYNDYGVGNS